MAIIKNKIGQSGLLSNPLLTQFAPDANPGDITTWGPGATDIESSLTNETETATVTATRTYWPELLAAAGAVGYIADPKRSNLYGVLVVAGLGMRFLSLATKPKV